MLRETITCCHWMMLTLVLAPVGCGRIKAPVALPGAMAKDRAHFDQAMNLAVQGDLRTALPILHRLPNSTLDDRQNRARESVLARFERGLPEPGVAGVDTWTAGVVVAYRTYWTRLMLGQDTREQAERMLGETLLKLLGKSVDPKASVNLSTLEPELLSAIQERGFHAILGVTTPYRECLLWKGQTESRFEVDLPEGREQVTVMMLSDFSSLGWVGYATGDLYYCGGWTKPDRLFCVAQAYDKASEAFRVSYLAHEGQHFRDSRLFQGLDQPELEYRAKLVEVALANQTLSEVLKGFQGNQSQSREQPHAYANRRLMDALIQALRPQASVDTPWWSGLDPARIHEVAQGLLAKDTKALSGSRGG